MKFNLDCTRDILFLLEKELTISSDLEILALVLDEIKANLNDYEIGEIANTLIILNEAGFIVADTIFSNDGIEDILVSRITYDGYQFIESIRPESVWRQVKNIGSKVGSFSINAVSQIAVATITSLIDIQLGL